MTEIVNVKMPFRRKTSGLPWQNNIACNSVPQVAKVQNFSVKLNFLKCKKGPQRYIEFLNHHKNSLPRHSEELTRFFIFKLLKETNKFYISNDLTRNFEQLIKPNGT